ncbi:hypothetical protein LN042_14065 [Kitasatospora sp. RB6PN24]|uniref:hypothetical protein n=1 Tax=Kitasatospora humi TaxID=2893891 RepID=UPI001E553787|nr:hypothetical protein [Kitasatospora humi]MCC9308200.1 hypothetical protein [Kitasatospora humi]
MTGTPEATGSAGGGRRSALPLFAAQAALVLLALLGEQAVPGGPARAVLVLPVLLWTPGRSLVAGLGLARGAGRFLAPLCVLLSILALIAGGLLCYAVLGRVRLAVLPFAVSTALLPLCLRERRAARPRLPDLLADGRRGAVYGVGVLAAAALLWAVAGHLPGAPQQPYVSFSLGAPYAQVSGVLPAAPGQRLDVPVVAGASRPADLAGLTVSAGFDGAGWSDPVALTGTAPGQGAARLQVTVPRTGCLHRVELRLSRGAEQLRSVDLYVRTGEGSACGDG